MKKVGFQRKKGVIAHLRKITKSTSIHDKERVINEWGVEKLTKYTNKGLTKDHSKVKKFVYIKSKKRKRVNVVKSEVQKKVKIE